jgi:hypothetical protein
MKQKMKPVAIAIICLFFLVLNLGFGAEPETKPLKYRYSFTLVGDAKGRILLFFPYRIYYEARADIELTAVKRNNTSYEFTLSSVKEAYVARTLDFGGKKMVLMNADYDYRKNMTFAQNKMNDLKTNLPYYSQYIKSGDVYPYEITNRDKYAVKFIRDINGIQKDVYADLKLLRKFDNPKFVTYFHIDKIMAESIKCFNFPTFPKHQPEELKNYMNKEWQSMQLDYSATMNEISRLISTFTEKHVKFEQEFPFRLKFKVAYSNPWTIHIIGEIYPNMTIWSDWKMKKVIRSVKISAIDFHVLEDEMTAEIRNKKGNGGLLRMLLKQVE